MVHVHGRSAFHLMKLSGVIKGCPATISADIKSRARDGAGLLSFLGERNILTGMTHNILNSRFFKDKEGKVVIYQFPNIPLIFWVGLSLMNHFVFGWPQQFIGLISFGFGYAWAYGEASSGVNGFRKLLGYGALIALTVSAFYKTFNG